MENKRLIILLLFMVNSVNADEYQTVCPDTDNILVAFAIDYGDYRRGATCNSVTITVKDSNGQIIQTVTNPTLEGNSIYSFKATIPPYKVAEEYKAYGVCDSVEEGEINVLKTFVIIDCTKGGDSTIPEIGLVDKILNGLKSFIPESVTGFTDKILKTIESDTFDKLGQMGGKLFDIFADTQEGIMKGASYMKNFILTPTKFILGTTLNALKAFLLILINTFFLAFIFLEIYIILRSFEKARDVFDLLWTIAEKNLNIVKGIVDYTLRFMDLMLNITNSLINFGGSIINAITNLVPF